MSFETNNGAPKSRGTQTATTGSALSKPGTTPAVTSDATTRDITMAATETKPATKSARSQRLERALFRGANLTLENRVYRESITSFLKLLLRADFVQDDLVPKDLTVEALGIKTKKATAVMLAREDGVVAGLEEVLLLLREYRVEAKLEKADGDAIHAADVLLRVEGDEMALLSLERVALNVLQRMSGISTAARRLQERASRVSPETHIVGTRKTLWGLLDKRALHLGNGGTHRLGLGDAILIKNNHLALIAEREEEAVRIAIERAWKPREGSAFIEVEVRGEEAALEAAKAFLRLQQRAAGEGTSEAEAKEYPCLVMLDNMAPAEIRRVLETLRREGLWESTLIEASGGVTEQNLEEYAATGVDAISIGALTHSARALNISQKIL
jgi:nicotinate-nucleotide pyrophosphorylase (carboxylating)